MGPEDLAGTRARELARARRPWRRPSWRTPAGSTSPTSTASPACSMPCSQDHGPTKGARQALPVYHLARPFLSTTRERSFRAASAPPVALLAGARPSQPRLIIRRDVHLTIEIGASGTPEIVYSFPACLSRYLFTTRCVGWCWATSTREHRV